MTRRRPPRRIDRLDDVTAARLATQTLGRRVPPSTVRGWKHQGLVAGGYGWFDRQSLRERVEKIKATEDAAADTDG